MYEISIIYPVTVEAIKNQDDSLTDVQSQEVFDYLQKTSDLENGLSWNKILKAINVCRKNWQANKRQIT